MSYLTAWQTAVFYFRAKEWTFMAAAVHMSQL